jgi:phosphatidylglycerophosphatase C
MTSDAYPSSEGPRPRIVAVFDFDGTLTYCDSLLPFLRSARGPLRFWWALLRTIPWLVGYAAGRVGRTVAKERLLRQLLGGLDEEAYRQAARRYVDRDLPRLLNASAIDRLDWHREQGHEVLLASSTLEAYLAPLASVIGADGVLATGMEVRDGALSGMVLGENCYGPEKVTRLIERVGALDAIDLYAYGDNTGDRELLAAAQHPLFRGFRGRGYSVKAMVKLFRALISP